MNILCNINQLLDQLINNFSFLEDEKTDDF